jgi:predicted DNA-binding transcriptional regulator AlpA
MIDAAHLWDTAEAAAYLGISPATLTTWRSDPGRAPHIGPPPCVRLGRGKRASVRYRPNDIQEWVERLVVA